MTPAAGAGSGSDSPVNSNFQVDLRGIVDLLSHHLYGSPRVYVRELLQNAVDAITARREIDPACPTSVRIVATGQQLEVHDSGVGLNADEVHRFLSTIGRSSKRDELDFARSDFLGQFGIGLLSAFLVADEVRVITRSARDLTSPVVEWVGRGDGSYSMTELEPGAKHEPGTTVVLTARHGCQEWMEPERVVTLAREFGSLLPYDVVVQRPGGTAQITQGPAPWEISFATPGDRDRALVDYCVATFGFEPLAAIELDVPGAQGVAYVSPTPTSPARRPRHRVYLKRMLLGDTVDGLLPEWAFFVRCVVNTTDVRPTASRESLYADEALADTQQALGRQLKQWLTDLASTDPELLQRFLTIHHMGVKALAQHDNDLLAAVLPFLVFETTSGSVTLRALSQQHDVIRYTDTTDEFRRISAVASAQGLAVVNGGYAYDAELLQRLPTLLPGVRVERLAPGSVASHLDDLDIAQEAAIQPFMQRAADVLGRLGCDVQIRSFDPISLPALYLDDREAQHERERARVAAEVDDVWGGILSALEKSTPRPCLVLNHRNALLRRISEVSEPSLVDVSIESVYVHALLMAHQPLQPADVAAMNRSFAGLLDWATYAQTATADPTIGHDDPNQSVQP